MFKALAKLTKSKSVPPSDDQIRRHRDQRRQAEQWRSDVDSLRRSMERLTTAYQKHKGDFALGRYEELKNMIKAAIQDLRAATAENKEHRTLVASSSVSSSTSISGMKQRAAEFAKQQEMSTAEERLYADKGSKVIDEEMEQLRREIIHLKKEFRTYRDRLELLAKDYEDSKKLAPPQRYNVLKELIKTATQPIPAS